MQIHFLYQVLRGFPPQQVFAQTLLGFEVASADPDVVGINFVMPEDGYISMRDYHLQMQMLDYLHSVYPKVHITLHAGELAPGMVPPAGLSFHIREAVNLGHAERIGHGVDVLYEDNPLRLLHEMAVKHIMVEVNLTSNDVILDVTGSDHPLHAYLAAHVPFALSTDDEGVSRIDLTHEYVKAADDQDLTYAELKQSARASLEHSFLHGESLYVTPDDFARRKPACAATDHSEQHTVPRLPGSAGRQREGRAAVGAGAAVRRLRGFLAITHRRFGTVCATLIAHKSKPERMLMKRAIAIILETILFLFVFLAGSLLAAVPSAHLPSWDVNLSGTSLLRAGWHRVHVHPLCPVPASRRRASPAAVGGPDLDGGGGTRLGSGPGDEVRVRYPLILQDLPIRDSELMSCNPHLQHLTYRW